MTTKEYKKVVNPIQLYSELVAAIPSLAPVGVGLNAVSQVLIRFDPQTIWLDFPENANVTSIDATVAAHIPIASNTVDPVSSKLSTIKGKTLSTLTVVERNTLFDAITLKLGLSDGTKIL